MYIELEEAKKKIDSLIIEPLDLFVHYSNYFSLELFSQQVL